MIAVSKILQIMIKHILGFPNLGFNFELKRAVEGYTAGKCSLADFFKFTKKICADNWLFQKSCGLDSVCVGDFSAVDKILNTILMLGAIPKRFEEDAKILHPMDLSLRMAGLINSDSKPLDSARWFDSRLFVSVPEIEDDMEFSFFSTKILEDTILASESGYTPKPCLVGPFTFLRLAKEANGVDKWSKIYDLAAVYCEILDALKEFCPYIQIAEPVFAEDYLLMNPYRHLIAPIYERLNQAAGNSKIILTSFFDAYEKNLDAALSAKCPVLHVDCTKSEEELDKILSLLDENTELSLGVVDGRNCWINDYEKSLKIIEKAKSKLGENKVMLASSCSLSNVPLDLDLETDIPQNLKNCLAFAKDKCRELSALADICEGKNLEILEARKSQIEFLNSGELGRNDDVRFQVQLTESKNFERAGNYKTREVAQAWLNMPKLPIALSDTPALSDSAIRASNYAKISPSKESELLISEAENILNFQQEAGLDLLSFSAFECLDAFEFFASNLNGFYFTQSGFVQIRGANVANPPIIYADVSRKKQLFADIAKKVKSLVLRPVKFSIAGAVSILKRSFARVDISESQLARQIALAVKEELKDLQVAGIRVIQIDESMLGDILPLKNVSRARHLQMATDCFKIAVSDADIATQIHLRLRFDANRPIVLSLQNMDSDVLILECGGLDLHSLEILNQFDYKGAVGIALSPENFEENVDETQLAQQISSALKYIKKDRLWIFTGERLKRANSEQAMSFLKNLKKAKSLI